jgi:hypothetical protein
MDGNGDHHVERDKPNPKKQISDVFANLCTVMMVIIMGHECKKMTILGGIRKKREEERKGKDTEG